MGSEGGGVGLRWSPFKNKISKIHGGQIFR